MVNVIWFLSYQDNQCMGTTYTRIALISKKNSCIVLPTVDMANSGYGRCPIHVSHHKSSNGIDVTML
jgi:hypothetical protein